MMSLLVLLLLGAVAAAGSGVGIGAATVRRNPTSLTFTVAVTLFGLFAIGCLLWVLTASLLGHRGARGGGGGAPARRPWWLTATLPIIVLIAIIVFAALHHRLHLPSERVGAAAPAGHTAGHSAVAFVPTASVWTVLVVVVLAAMVLLRRRLSGWLRRRRPFEHLERTPDEDVWSSGQSSPLARTLAEVRVPDPHEEPDPRRAVVAAYVAMTHAAGEAGVVRKIDETPSEFLERLLGAAGASGDAVGHLTAVFELARYTSRPVGESVRSSAIAALHRVRTELGAAV